MKKTFKNLLKVPYPFSQIAPGETATVELIGDDDIHLRGVKLGWLEEVKEGTRTTVPSSPKKKGRR